MRSLALLVFMVVAFGASTSFGWGSYGHEQINSEAVDLVKGTPLGSCFQKNRDLLVRLAITPDVDWKMSPQEFFTLGIDKLVESFPQEPKNTYYLGKLKKILDKESKKKKKILSADLVAALGRTPADAGLLAKLRDQEQAAGHMVNLSENVLLKKREADNVEHSLHFWEADAFTSAPQGALITGLPSDPDYDGKDLIPYEKKAMANADYISETDPCKVATKNQSRDVIQHGTAPWRALNLLKAGAALLSNAVAQHDNQKFARALLLLGTMGHYVGDMGQPFHATLNYDGQGTGPETMGIHSTYEEKILEVQAKKMARAKKDKETGLWSPFDATSPTVDKYSRLTLGGSSLTPVSESDVIPSIFKLVASGYDLIPRLLSAFKAARNDDPAFVQTDLPLTECGRTKGQGSLTAIHAVTVHHFMDSRFTLPGSGDQITVLESAEKRMGESAAELARLWLTAYNLSHLSARDLQSFCPAIAFDRSFAIMNYPQADFHRPLGDFAKIPEEAGADGASGDDTSTGTEK